MEGYLADNNRSMGGFTRTLSSKTFMADDGNRKANVLGDNAGLVLHFPLLNINKVFGSGSFPLL